MISDFMTFLFEIKLHYNAVLMHKEVSLLPDISFKSELHPNQLLYQKSYIPIPAK